LKELPPPAFCEVSCALFALYCGADVGCANTGGQTLAISVCSAAQEIVSVYMERLSLNGM
jgi:hypothetical protein